MSNKIQICADRRTDRQTDYGKTMLPDLWMWGLKKGA